MGAARRPGQDAHDGATGTLGDLLYADTASIPVPEKEWAGLVQAIAAGDQQALYALYERTHRLVFTLSLRITSSRETADEVVLDVFHDVWRRAATYDPAAGSVLGWIMNQARSRAIDRLRFEQRKKRVNARVENPLPPAAASDPLERCAREEQGRRLREALAVLTPQERELIETAFFAQLTYSEVAARLQQPLGTVKTRIRAGLLKLRQALAGSVTEP
ncbi:MAG TPA: sigma-70 family RNA polymerase sigma factor [Methylomirabilota bacterium]|nr:sigma-70 family RNA polymerase sigma factor [Methylomirabilota bacterium]